MDVRGEDQSHHLDLGTNASAIHATIKEANKMLELTPNGSYITQVDAILAFLG